MQAVEIAKAEITREVLTMLATTYSSFSNLLAPSEQTLEIGKVYAGTILRLLLDVGKHEAS